ncbi:MAG: DUF1501 domain-containing protein [Myxococcaceae bacterium]|nr:DUF1501 domain-containing protein [Myxococcaceae bacterium]
MTFKLPVVDQRLSRRNLLKSLGAVTGGFMLADFLLPRAALAAAKDPKRKFVFAYFEGGWDQLLALDPRDPATTNPMTQLIDPGYGQLGYGFSARGVRTVGNLSFGPAVPQSFIDVANECSIIKGITMDTAAHEVGRRYFITGRFPRGLDAVGSSTASEILAQIGESSPIAHISAGVEAYAEKMPAFAQALNVNSIADMSVALTPLVTLDPKVKEAVEKYQDLTPGCEAVRLNRDGLTSALLESVKRSRGYLTSNLAGVFDLTRMDAEMAALRTLYDIGAAGGDASAPEVMGFLAGQAIKKNVSQCVSFQAARSLDTHAEWAADHPGRLETGFKVLGALIKDLKNTPGSTPGKTMLDETTIMAFSEFARTPLFNNIRGRDHFLGNSVLVAGAGVKRGLTVGGSAAVGQMPIETDLTTGIGYETPTQMMRDSGQVQILTPKHVLATVLASAGLDYAYLRVEPIKALLP